MQRLIWTELELPLTPAFFLTSWPTGLERWRRRGRQIHRRYRSSGDWRTSLERLLQLRAVQIGVQSDANQGIEADPEPIGACTGLNVERNG